MAELLWILESYGVYCNVDSTGELHRDTSLNALSIFASDGQQIPLTILQSGIR